MYRNTQIVGLIVLPQFLAFLLGFGLGIEGKREIGTLFVTTGVISFFAVIASTKFIREFNRFERLISQEKKEERGKDNEGEKQTMNLPKWKSDFEIRLSDDPAVIREIEEEGESMIIEIDRTKPFDPDAIIGWGWKMGAQDERSVAITQINFNQIELVSMLRPEEESIESEEWINRLMRSEYIPLDAAFFLYLWQNQHLIESWTGNIYFEGSILLNVSGERCILCLDRIDKKWFWNCVRTDWCIRNANISELSAVIKA